MANVPQTINSRDGLHPNENDSISSEHLEKGVPTVEKKDRRILSQHKTCLWLLVTLVIVVTAAAVGGGVGGYMSSKHSK